MEKKKQFCVDTANGKQEFDLFQALANYTPFDEIEAGHLKSVCEFISRGGDLFSRSNLEGHINGSGFLMNADLTKLLMTHHKALDKWLQFGGHSDGDENTMNVAARETMEESGIENFKPLINGIADIDVHPIPENKKKGEPEHLHYDIRFIFTTDESEYIVSDESNDLRWLTLDEFKQLETNEARQRFIAKWETLQKERAKGVESGNRQSNGGQGTAPTVDPSV